MKVKKLKINWKILFISLALVYFVAFAGSFFTSPGINSGWYETVKPSITPPDWVFPVVWNILFFLIGLSLYFSWTSAKSRGQRRNIAIVFVANFLANILWTFLYFTLRSPQSAFIELVLFLWPSTLAMVLTARKINPFYSYLLIPYLLWVSFAGILNYLSIPLPN